MIILQKWEPVISDTFPSMIRFLIELQGIPIHYWQPKMMKSIGEELEEILDLEITSFPVKIRILINGLEPLIKETVVDFHDGSETIVLLEYKNLKNHYHHCFQLSHEKKNCLGLKEEKEVPVVTTSFHQNSTELSRNYYTPKDNFTPPKSQQGVSFNSDSSQTKHSPLKRKFPDRERRSHSHSEARSFSRNHLPSRAPPDRSNGYQERRPSKEPSYHSTSRGHYRSSQQNTLQWKEKSPQIQASHLEISDSSRTRRPPLARNLSSMASLSPPLHRLNSLEVISPPILIPTKE